MSQVSRALAAVGDVNQINTWSNIPYFFLQAGRELGFFGTGLALNPERLRVQRLLWNAYSFFSRGETGGFQYTETFLNQLFNQCRPETEGSEIISHFPLLPPASRETRRKVSYYIDATLKQNFEDYGLASKVGRRVREDAIKRERENYLAAERIICMSRWAAASVVRDYGVAASNVHVIHPGANLAEAEVNEITKEQSDASDINVLRLGFIGKDWKRKGLPFLLKVAERIEGTGKAVEVVVIGPSGKELPKHPLIKAEGFIDKQRDTKRFAALVRSFHFGCLFSSAEAYGISNLECLRLGVPVLANRLGGLPDTVPEGLGFLFEPHSSPEKVATLLEFFIENPAEYHQLRQRVIARGEEFTWHQTVQNFIKLWDGSSDFRYAP